MISILCSPKPFAGINEWNQLNALNSWRGIADDIEIILFGTSHGAAEAAKRVNAIHVAQIETSESGAPMFNCMVKYADEYARYPLRLYVNSDILLTRNIVDAILAASKKFVKFLAIGERLDLLPGVHVDTSEPAWYNSLLRLVQEGKLVSHGPNGIDYFGFAKGMWAGLPPVYMGRALCDQTLLHYCLARGIPLVDNSQSVIAVHQYHDYGHVKDGKAEVYYGKDRQEMSKVHGLRYSFPIITDAQWAYKGGVLCNSERARTLRRLELKLRYGYRSTMLSFLVRGMQYWRGKASVRACRLSEEEITTLLSAM